ncbi:MAG: serine/threonine protein kinase, partial [Planctomycetes bacterium]|nr:serine/threonine protein kinase [Planctomycetota bacterium]
MTPHSSDETRVTDSAPRAADPPTGPTEQTLLPAPSDAGADATRVGAVPRPFGAPGGLPAVPGYEVVREVARGGMGAVFVARDPAFDREVAIKVMHHGQDADRFVIESKVTAQLPHPGVPPVYALGTLPDGRPFLAMKLIGGRTLADELRAATPADLPRLLGAFERVCETVGFAHARGIIHRDLKPANVMVGAFGEVLVMDWGLAKQVVSGQQAVGGEGQGSAEQFGAPRVTEDATLAGQVKGTPAYMAPEQARGEEVDARADVFALGGILAAILTGRAPFGGTTVMDTIRCAAAADLSEVFARLDNCAADPDLVAVAKRCLAPAAPDRYADGAAAAGAVAAYRAGVAERLQRAERERAAAEARAAEEVNTRREAEACVAEHRKRRKAQALLAASVLVLAAGAAAFAWYSDRESERAKRKQAEFDAVQAREEAERAALAALATVAAERERGAKERARQGAEGNLRLAAELRQQFKFKAAEAALAQAAGLAAGAPDLLPRVEAARRDLALVAKLDDIRYRKCLRTAGGKTGDEQAAKVASAAAYKAALAAHGFDFAALAPDEAATRVRAAPVAAELVAALDDWAVYEPDATLRDRLLAVARAAD